MQKQEEDASVIKEKPITPVIARVLGVFRALMPFWTHNPHSAFYSVKSVTPRRSSPPWVATPPIKTLRCCDTNSCSKDYTSIALLSRSYKSRRVQPVDMRSGAIAPESSTHGKEEEQLQATPNAAAEGI